MGNPLFNLWAEINKVPVSDDYDMEGFFNDMDEYNEYISPVDNKPHFPDKYKRPNHKTFGVQSKYWDKSYPVKDWIGNLFINYETGDIEQDDIKDMLFRSLRPRKLQEAL